MGTIGNLLNNGYYSLSGSSSGTASAASSTSSNLLAALDGTGSGSGSSAYSLNLSPQAQQLLSGASSTGSASSSSDSSSNFVLTTQQQATIGSILAKYKSAPYTQATFDSIQADLKAAGLSPKQLSAQDQVTSFNATAVLVSALDGNYVNLSAQSAQTSATEQTKSANYMQSILSQWQSLNTTAASSSSPRPAA